MTVYVPPTKFVDLPNLPDWVPPLDTGQPSADDLNASADIPRTNFAARNSPIPIPYGRGRFFGQPFVVTICESSGCLLVAFGLGEGEIEAFESIIVDSDDVLANGTGYIGLKDRGFESGTPDFWTGADSINGTLPRTGAFSGAVLSAAGGPNMLSDYTPSPAEGTVMRVSGYVQRDPLDLPDANISIALRFYDAGLVAVGGRDPGTPPDGAVNSGASGTAGWQKLETNVTVPAGAAFYRFDFGESPGTTGRWYCDDADTQVLAVDNPSLTVDAMEFVAYRGEPTQTVDSILARTLVGYQDTQDGLAYIVGRFPPSSTSGFPRVETIFQGRKVYDPRLDTTNTDAGGSGPHRIADPTTWEYSANPALCFRDMIENFSGWDILDAGVADLADYNDEVVDGHPRREIGLNITRPQTVEAWTKTFRTYMGGFIGWEDGKIRVVPNRADVIPAGAVLFDGSAGTWVNIGDPVELAVGTGDFTIELTFRGVNNSFIAGKFSGAIGWTFYFNGGGFLEFLIHDGTTFNKWVSSTPQWDGEWHTMSASVNRTTDELIVVLDGVSQTPVDISTTTGSLTTSSDLRVGSSSAGAVNLDGAVDEFRFWDDVRTPSEISDNRFVELSNPEGEANLIGYWKFNDATGSTAVDSSSNSNDGTLAGNAVFTHDDILIEPLNLALVITADDIVKDSMRVRRRSLRNTPNTVAVDYVDASNPRWRTERVIAESARVISEEELRRLSRISLPGIHNATQAQREATERLNWYLTDLECTFTMFDTGWQLQTGSIIEVTHPIGLSKKLFRVTRLTGESGRWTIDASEYDPAVYSDEVIADPTLPDTNLGNPLSPPLATNVAAVEELFTKKDGTTGSRVRITYDAPVYPFFSQFLVEGYVDDVKVFQINTQSNEVVTPGVEQLVITDPVDYEVRVYVQSPFATGDAETDIVTVQGKLAPPANVSTLTATVLSADTVELQWSPVVDIDIWRYEVRQGTPSDTWETATFIDLMDDIDNQVAGLALGTYRFFVKAIDSVRNESPTAKTVDVTLQSPAAVASLTGFEVASEVRLSWQRPVGGSGFVERYRIAYDTIPPSNEITLDVVDTLRFQTKDVPEGTWRFLVYSRDGVGNEASTAATADIEVTSDADAFLADSYQFVQATDQHALGSITNMHEYELRLDDRLLYVTNMGDAFLSSPSDFDTFSAEALANYHSTGASEWLSETKDFGLLLTGSWNLNQDVVALNGNVDVVLELSPDDVTYTSYLGAARGEFRYARVRVSTSASPGTATAWVRSPVMNVRINVVPLEESGEGQSNGTEGVPSVVLLDREYTALKEVNAQPKNKTDALMAVVDNIIIGSNTAVKGDGVQSLTAGDVLDRGSNSFTWEFWARRAVGSTANDANLIAKRDGTNGFVIRADQASNELQMVLIDGTNTINITTTDDAFAVADGFTHFAWVIDRGTNVMRLYKDSVEVTGSPWSISTLTGSLDNAGPLVLFDHSTEATGVPFDGDMDQVRLWGDVRSASEISENYQNSLDMTVTQAGLDGYWLLDGPVGDSVATTGGAIPDQTINGNDFDATASGLIFVDPGGTNPVRKRNSFDVYVFDIFGQQLSEAYQWNWKAV